MGKIEKWINGLVDQVKKKKSQTMALNYKEMRENSNCIPIKTYIC